jgi:parvulin-like peptidyl-prolyl isomerase
MEQICLDKFAACESQQNDPQEQLMRRIVREQLDQVERDIKLYVEFDKAEKDRFNRESYLWTAEDRIEWQETQSDNAQRLRELREERDALRSQLEE